VQGKAAAMHERVGGAHARNEDAIDERQTQLLIQGMDRATLE
jgi:hypothetical protein